MNLASFFAASAADAVRQIHAQLGPEAVIVAVRPRPAQGWARLWPGSAGIEVLAMAPPEKAETQEHPTAALLGLDDRGPSGLFSQPPSLAPDLPLPGGGRNSVCSADAAPNSDEAMRPGAGVVGCPTNVKRAESGSHTQHRWRSVTLLERLGLSPPCAERLDDALDSLHGLAPPNSLAEEFVLTRTTLARFWRPPPAVDGGAADRPHVFVGPPGAGKTTVLCKWLTHAVLAEGRVARVWRLDGATANMGESLSVYGEILGVPVERVWADPNRAGAKPDPVGAGVELRFIDLPGVEAQDRAGLQDLRDRLRRLPSPHVHLVLNGAYEVPTLLAQIRAFEAAPIHDVSFTHLDEEPNWAKLWNFVLGTSYSIRFLSAGQNIPGQFLTAAPGILFPKQFREPVGEPSLPPQANWPWQTSCFPS